MTPDEKRLFARTFPVHVGVDTGKTLHVLVAQGPDGRRTPSHRVEVSRAAFAQADARLRTWFPGVRRDQTLIGLEFAGHHGFTFARYLDQRTRSPGALGSGCSLRCARPLATRHHLKDRSLTSSATSRRDVAAPPRSLSRTGRGPVARSRA